MCVFLPQTGSETRNFKRTRRPAGTSCCCKDGGREAARWRCGYEISAERSFHMCVFLPQTVSEMRYFERTHGPAGTPLQLQEQWQWEAARWRCGCKIPSERLFRMHVFLPQTVSEMGLRENAPSCWQAMQSQEYQQWEAARRRFGHDFSIPFISRSAFSIKPLSKRKSA